MWSKGRKRKKNDGMRRGSKPAILLFFAGIMVVWLSGSLVLAGDEPIPLSAIVSPCAEAKNGVKRVVIHGGTRYAAKGEVFGFDREYLFADKCQELEITLVIEEPVRHLFMTNNLDPMFMLEVVGPGQKIGSFVTPDELSIIHFHCHVSTHKTMGMSGTIIVGFGTESNPK